MSRLNLTLFEGECELLSYEPIGDGALEIKVDSPIEGKLFIGPIIADMLKGECSTKPYSLPDGIYTPCLYGEGDMITLPVIKKCGDIIRPEINREEELLRVASRARRAIGEARSLALEVERLRALIEGSRLAIGQEK